MTEHLFVFALRTDTDLRHTHLTRASGEAPALPPLTDWLGAEVDETAIEIFPVKDLGDMSLSEYASLAFAPETIPAQDARRMDALKGTVLLVPEHALSEEPAPGKEAKLIATLPLAKADHAGQLPKADVTPPPRPPDTPVAGPKRRGSVVWILLAIAVLAALVLWIVT